MAVQSVIQPPLSASKPRPSLHFHVHCFSSPQPPSSSSQQIPSNSSDSWREKINGARMRASMPFQGEIPPNALRRKQDPLWWGGFSLGVDLGSSRTGLAISKGFSVRPLTVLNLKGQKLELRLIEIAKKKEVDEFIIGLPKSSDGNETLQSNKVRSVAGRIAVRAAEWGWRVYLQDEYGTSADAMHRMINLGVSKSARHERIDAYAAVMPPKSITLHLGEELNSCGQSNFITRKDSKGSRGT